MRAYGGKQKLGGSGFGYQQAGKFLAPASDREQVRRGSATSLLFFGCNSGVRDLAGAFLPMQPSL